jgi:hypothetical protein
MNYRIAIHILAITAMLAIPAIAYGKTIPFEGKAVGAGAYEDTRITFDVSSSKGRPGTISNIFVENAQFICQSAGETVRNVRMFGSGTFAKNGKFDVRETQPPPGADNWLLGKFSYPKKGKRKKPTIKGTFLSEFGYSPTSFDEYNCIAGEDFVATPAK